MFWTVSGAPFGSSRARDPSRAKKPFASLSPKFPASMATMAPLQDPREDTESDSDMDTESSTSSITEIEEDEFQVSVKFHDTTIYLAIAPRDAIITMKYAVQIRLGIMMAAQRWQLHGRILQDHQTAQEIGLREGDQIQMHLRLLGGGEEAQPERPVTAEPRKAQCSTFAQGLFHESCGAQQHA